MKTQNAHALIQQFAALYAERKFTAALRLLLTPPPDAYPVADTSAYPFLTLLVNYADAAVYSGPMAYNRASEALQQAYTEQAPAVREGLGGFMATLQEEYLFFHLSRWSPMQLAAETRLPAALKMLLQVLKQDKMPDHAAVEQALSQLPPLFTLLFEQKIANRQGLEVIHKAHPILTTAIEKQLALAEPWHAFTYEASPTLITYPLNLAQSTPVIFLELYAELQDPAFIAACAIQPAIFVIPTVTVFCQLLRCRLLDTLWQDPRHLIYIMELYPQEQWLAQRPFTISHPLQPYWPGTTAPYPYSTTAFLEALQHSLSTATNDAAIVAANTLYAIAKRTLAAAETQHYGSSRAIALSIEQGLRAWHDPHRTALPPSSNEGICVHSAMAQRIRTAQAMRVVRKIPLAKKIHLVHITQQLVDEGHAPTKLLRTLIEQADRATFELSVISTERLVVHPRAYPILSYQSAPSTERGKNTLYHWESSGITTAVLTHMSTYEAAVERTLQLLEEFGADIAVFHGPDEINSLVAATTATPRRVLFDHGTLPIYSCFDLVILSTDEAYRQHKDHFQLLHMDSAVLHFCSDSRISWQPEPPTRTELGLPAEAFVLTTISNHLDNRLSQQMCMAIGEILTRCPQAVYAPIGAIRQEERLRGYFEKYGVNDRIYFLGDHPAPSQLARAMHLYLNEFPLGSGLAILDAMAAGCPIVSMYNPHGPQASYYGGVYFGVDRVISNGKVEDYVKLACRLIRDPALYREWSKYALQRYHAHIDTKSYVAHFEAILTRMPLSQ